MFKNFNLTQILATVIVMKGGCYMEIPVQAQPMQFPQTIVVENFEELCQGQIVEIISED